MAIPALSGSSRRDLLDLPASTARGRVLAIDVVRGLLICLITLGHGHILLSDSESNRRFILLISKITNLGTPGFTFLSGLLLGYFEYTHSDFRRIQRKYFLRGLQLLTLAHLLIAVGTYPLREETSFIQVYLRYGYITDTLAILFLSLPTLVPRLRPSVRMAIGIGSLLSWKLLVLFPPVSSPGLLLLKELFFGLSPSGEHLLGDSYPIVPLGGLFMIGTVFGNRFAQSRAGGTPDRFVKRLRLSVVPLLFLSGGFIGMWIWGKLNSERPWGSALKLLFYPEKLSSLLPFYLAALFLILAHVIVKIDIVGEAGRMEKALALFGRNSLFAYVAQYFLVQTIPSLIGWRNHLTPLELSLYLGGTIMILYYFVRLYNHSPLRRWRSAKREESRPSGIKRGEDLSSLLNTPELLDLKKDLW
ncbi:MAG: DUF1624 domain-containing protein [Candidatus Manganitrophaceae bacterium]|nr:MAG: DUF1624 domain-containing protein [Candidatus Manganitrophaceae bacterium]